MTRRKKNSGKMKSNVMLEMSPRFKDDDKSKCGKFTGILSLNC